MTEASSRAILDYAGHLRSLLAFAESCQPPDDIYAIWSNQWVSVLYWFMYHPKTSAKISDGDRAKALSILFKGGGKETLRRLVSRSSLPKRIAFPLVLLAGAGIQFPAKFFFRRVYYPVLSMR